jgi:ABC-type polysaccharide/polyol phosphate transport system ATPase subunit
MRPGQIVAQDVSRRFRVYPHRNVTLKEAVIRRRHVRPTEIWALRDVDLEVEAGESIAFIGRNGSGKTTLLRLIAGIFAPSSGRLEVGGTVGSLLELGAGFHPDFTGRENIFLSASIYGLRRNVVRERMDEIIAFSELEDFVDIPVRTYSSGMYMRLGFAIAVHVEADVLLLDEVFAVGDEAFQRKCIDRVLRFRERGGTVCFVSHDASAVERLCERAVLLTHGQVEYDGETSEALKRYHKLLALEEAPAEIGAGLREWGSGEVSVAAVRIEGPDGRPTQRFASGDPMTVRLRLVAEAPVPAPRLSLELRDSGGSLLGASMIALDEVGWNAEPGERSLRFSVERLPLAGGEFQLGITLTDNSGSKRYHRMDRAADFSVVAADNSRGLLRFEGEWEAEGAEVGAG